MPDDPISSTVTTGEPPPATTATPPPLPATPPATGDAPTIYVPSLAPAPTISMRVPGIASPVVVSAPPPGTRLEIPMPPSALRWLSVHGVYLAVVVAVSLLFGFGKMDRGLFLAVITYVVGKYDDRPNAERTAKILPDTAPPP